MYHAVVVDDHGPSFSRRQRPGYPAASALAEVTVELDPFVQTTSDDPYPAYRELREKHPLARYPGRDLWVVSRHADVLGVIKTPEIFSSAQGTVPSGFVADKPMLISQDPPRHTRLRKAVQRAFTPRRMAALEPSVRKMTRELIEAFPEPGPVDLWDAFTNPLPVNVISALLGVDRGQRAMFTRCGDAIIHGQSDPNSAFVRDAEAELFGYLAEIVPQRRAQPGDDLMSLLLQDSEEAQALDTDELLGFCALLLLAGTETTTMGLTNSLMLLDRHRDVRQRLVREPALWPRAVEELLRFESPVQGLTRTLLRDAQIRGETLREGERVHMLFGAANRDDEVFVEPDQLDVTREPNPHLAFGFGIHFCLGASLARMELRVALQELLARAPDYEVDPAGASRVPSDTNRGFDCLPVQLDP